MFEIDKQKFGTFVAELRKEKGYTQKDLAQRLFISDKAISKWETGASIPDTALLIPLADLLGVSVTELLMCQRMDKGSLDAGQVESLVKTAITYSEEDQTRAYQQKSQWGIIYTIAFIVCCIEMLLTYSKGYMSASMPTIVLLGAIFGAYFCFFAKSKLPTYYDENRINAYSDGVFRMNVPGVYFNNSNWPHLLNVGRIWSVASMVVYPAFYFAMAFFIPEIWRFAELGLSLILCLGGLFIPFYIVGRKYG
jgi:transcriptional regulator with XRE-family HTH domain